MSSRGIVVWCAGLWTYRGIVELWLPQILVRERGLSRWLLVFAACPGCFDGVAPYPRILRFEFANSVQEQPVCYLVSFSVF